MRQPAEARRPIAPLAALAASLVLGSALAAGQARAATPEPRLSLARAVAAKSPSLKLPRPGADFAPSYAAAAGAGQPGQGRTALDRRIGDGVSASVGYLCGIDRYAPDSYQRGGGPDTAYGHKGTFLGASLGYSFK